MLNKSEIENEFNVLVKRIEQDVIPSVSTIYIDVKIISNLKEKNVILNDICSVRRTDDFSAELVRSNKKNDSLIKKIVLNSKLCREGMINFKEEDGIFKIYVPSLTIERKRKIKDMLSAEMLNQIEQLRNIRGKIKKKSIDNENFQQQKHLIKMLDEVFNIYKKKIENMFDKVKI